MQILHSTVSPASTPRERIVLTAHELFYQEGIRATGIDRVIAAAGVTKVTFYRHFPSKNDLVLEFLEYRHQLWISWFIDALDRHGGNIKALLPALREWFESKNFRGCAFINSVGELGGSVAEVMDITQRHKQDMTKIIKGLLPASNKSELDAQAIALAIDGAIIRAQFDQSIEPALKALNRFIKIITRKID